MTNIKTWDHICLVQSYIPTAKCQAISYVVVWLGTCNPILKFAMAYLLPWIRTEAMTHKKNECDTDSVPQWCKAHCMQPSGCPRQGFRKEKCHSPFRISKCYWLGQPVKVKQNFWNLYTSAVNIDKGCLKTLKWTVKSVGYMIWLKLIKELAEKQYFLEWHEHPVNILIFHTIRLLPYNAVKFTQTKSTHWVCVAVSTEKLLCIKENWSVIHLVYLGLGFVVLFFFFCLQRWSQSSVCIVESDEEINPDQLLGGKSSGGRWLLCLGINFPGLISCLWTTLRFPLLLLHLPLSLSSDGSPLTGTAQGLGHACSSGPWVQSTSPLSIRLFFPLSAQEIFIN